MKTTPCTETKVATTPFYAFNLAQMFGAKTRSGTHCKSPAVRSKSRCRMHGGARGSGATKGNQNAFKHGGATNEVRAIIRHAKILLQRSRRTLERQS